MKIYLVAFAALMLIGCSDSAKTVSYPAAPPELADCKFFFLTNKDGHSINVVRCPHSDTTATYRSGKSTVSTVTIDGVEYVKKETR